MLIMIWSVSDSLIQIPIELTLSVDYDTSIIAILSLSLSFQAVYNQLEALDYMLMMISGAGYDFTQLIHLMTRQ